LLRKDLSEYDLARCNDGTPASYLHQQVNRRTQIPYALADCTCVGKSYMRKGVHISLRECIIMRMQQFPSQISHNFSMTKATDLKTIFLKSHRKILKEVCVTL